ncbi:Xaa-Pro dipeptidyl-peptidase [Herbihabitans rhizosphaerae]|nr:Xaa-Pro dipeptidyl-peptidase [Herbihabitans rhizosphaerae]
MRPSRLLLCAAIALVAVPVPLASAEPPPSDRPVPPPWLKMADGMSQPQFATADAIDEVAFVETTVDSDKDGKKDRVRVTVERPAVAPGAKVPVLFEHSPYRYGTNPNAPNHNVDVDRLPQEDIRPNGPAGDGRTRTGKMGTSAVDTDYWVSRGYATVLGESIGTAGSDGCPTVGDMNEALAGKAIIDWLNGRAPAWNEAGEPVTADWSTGDVAMTGVSYDGTLPNMIATTGVEGLRTIIPISAISNWYDYYRAGGLVRAPHSNESGTGTNSFQGEDLSVLAEFVQGEDRLKKCKAVTDGLRTIQDRHTGDYSADWKERDYLQRANGVKASVFVVHGLEDYNVMPTAFASWWEALRRNNVPRKIWLHNGGHGGPQGGGYQQTLTKWMDHWLFGVDNGIMDEPLADVQRPAGDYVKSADWPVPDSRDTTLHLSAPNATDPGALRPAPGGPADVRQSFVDKGRELNTDKALVPNPDTANPNRLVYLSEPLGKEAHLSGTPSVSVKVSVDNRFAANLTAVLVDYGPAGSTAAPVVVTRGWADPQNRESLDASKPIEQGTEYPVGWKLEPDDHVFAQGHRIGLVIVSTDQQFTLRPTSGTKLSVTPAGSSLVLPVVGGLG